MKKKEVNIKIGKRILIFGTRNKWMWGSTKANEISRKSGKIDLYSYYIGYWTLIWFGKPLPQLVSDKIKKKIKYDLPYQYKRQKKLAKRWFREVVLRQPIYYQYFSRDCDCYESGGYSYAKNRKAYNENEQAFYEGAEGECWMKRCSKEEYEANKDVRHERDRVMEAFENGSNFYV